MIILEMAIQGDKVMQDFESGSFAMGVDHSQKAQKIASIYRLQLPFLGLSY